MQIWRLVEGKAEWVKEIIEPFPLPDGKAFFTWLRERRLHELIQSKYQPAYWIVFSEEEQARMDASFKPVTNAPADVCLRMLMGEAFPSTQLTYVSATPIFHAGEDSCLAIEVRQKPE